MWTCGWGRAQRIPDRLPSRYVEGGGEAVVFIEGGRRGVDGVDHDDPCCGDVRSGSGSGQSIPQQLSPQSW